VELKKGRGGITVTTMGMEPLASDIVVDSMIVDSGSVASAITKLFTEHNIKAKAVATSVSGHSVIVKPNVKMPAMSDGELSDVIQQEAAQYIPFDIADVNIDFQILNDESLGPQMDVLLVAVKKDKILNYTNVLSLAGKAPAVVDIDAFALQNCYEYNYEPAPNSTVAPSRWTSPKSRRLSPRAPVGTAAAMAVAAATAVETAGRSHATNILMKRRPSGRRFFYQARLVSWLVTGGGRLLPDQWSSEMLCSSKFAARRRNPDPRGRARPLPSAGKLPGFKAESSSRSQPTRFVWR
jgi:hypothetical protein